VRERLSSGEPPPPREKSSDLVLKKKKPETEERLLKCFARGGKKTKRPLAKARGGSKARPRNM